MALGLLLLIALVSAEPGAAGWREPVPGPIDKPTKWAGTPDLVEVAGTPWVTWAQTGEDAHEVRAARLTAAGTWEEVGGGVNHSLLRSADSPSIAAVGDVPWIAWREHDGTNEEIRVARLSGAGWIEVVGGASPVNADPSRNAADPQLLSVGGHVHLVWSEHDGVNSEIRAARYDVATNDWIPFPMGPSPINHDPARDAFAPSLADVGGRACVSWHEHDGDNRIARAACEPQGRVGIGSKWPRLGGRLNDDLDADAWQTEIASVAGVPVVAWSEDRDDPKRRGYASALHAARLVAGAWQPLGPEVPLHATDEPPSLIAAGGRAWLAAFEIPDGIQNFDGESLRVARFDDPSWSEPTAGQAPVNSGLTFAGVLAPIGGIPWIAWEQENYDGGRSHVRVARLEPEFLSASATAATDGAELSTAVRSFGLPHRIGFELGDAFARRTALQTTTGETSTITGRVNGVPPATEVAWRPVATAGVAAPAITGPTASFRTPTAPPADLAPAAPAAPPPPVATAPPPAAPTQATEAPLTIKLKRTRLRVRPGQRVTTTFTLNRPANVTFTLRRGKRTVRRTTVPGQAGTNRVTWTAPRRRGVYTARLTASQFAGGSATARTRVAVVAPRR